MADVVYNLEPEAPMPGVSIIEGYDVDSTNALIAPLDEAIALERAQKQHLALGPQSPGVDELASAVGTPREQEYRRQAALNRDITLSQIKSAKIKNYIEQKKELGEPIDDKDIDFIRQLTYSDLSDERTILERKYAEFMQNRILDEYQRKPLNEQFEHSILAPKDGMDMAFEEMITKHQWSLNKLEDLENRFKKQSYGQQGLDYIETIIPGATWWNLANLNHKGGFGLPGSMIQERIQRYTLLPAEQAITELERDIEEMYEANPRDAINFLQYVIKYSSHDKMIENVLLGGGDIATFASPLKALALAGAARAITGGRVTSMAQVLENVGKIDQAAALMITKELEQLASNVPKGASFESLRMGAWSIFLDPDKILAGGGLNNRSATFLTNLKTLLKTNQSNLVEGAFLRPITIDRLVPGTAAWDSAMADTKRMMEKIYDGTPQEAIINIRPVAADDTLSNTHHMVWEIGTKGGHALPTENSARLVAEELYGIKPGSFKLVETPAGWHIEVAKAVDETAISVRKAMAIETKNSTPTGRFSPFLRGLTRSKDDILPSDLVSDLKVATYGGSGLSKLMKEVAEPIRKLQTWSGKSHKEFLTFLEHQRDYIDPITAERGKFSRSLPAFEKDWFDLHGRIPTEQEIAAYFTYVQLNDIDWLMRNIAIYRDKTRQGLELINLPFPGSSGTRPYIEAKLVDDIDWNNPKSTGILVWNPDVIGASNKMRHQQKQFLKKKEIDDLVSKGYRIYQLTGYGNEALWNTLHASGRTLGQMMDIKHVTYVVAKDVNHAPLSFKQIPYKPGGHVVYPDDGVFISQANIQSKLFNKIRYNTYLGDRNLLHFDVSQKALAHKFAGIYEEGRKLLKAGKTAEAKLLIENATPHSIKEFTSWFDPKTGHLSLDHKILVREKGKSLEDQHKISKDYVGEWEDLRHSPYNLYNSQVNLQYATQRGDTLYTMANLGTEENPLWKTRPTKLIDPVAAMDNIANNMMQNRYMDDLRFKMAERFMAEFSDVLEDSAAKIARDPFGTLVEGNFKKNHADKELLAKARNFRRSTLEFLSLKSDFEKEISYMIEKTARSVLGEKWGGRVERYLLSSERNPVRFLRSLAFHEKLGLLNPTQFFLQAQTASHVIAVEGLKNGALSTVAYIPTRALLMNPRHADHIGNMVAKLGWKKEHFLESVEAFKKSGMPVVAGEYAARDDFANPKLVRSALGTALDSATLFFKEGELLTRTTAWHAAYRRWRDANPKATLNNKAMREIVARADLLTMNMTRASNATWQKGVASVPTQFWSYQARLMEQMMGKRLTGLEKAKVMTMYSVMYGMPVAAGGAIGFWPVSEHVRGWLLNNNYDYDDNMVTKVLMDGIPSVLIEGIQYMDGDKPTKFDVGSRYGPGGNPILWELLYGKKSLGEALGGVGLTTFNDTATHVLGPFLRTLVSTVRDDDEWYKLKGSDFIHAATQVSTIRSANVIWNALKYGEYRTKDEGIIDDKITTGEATVMMLGIKPQRINDMWTMTGYNKGLEQHKRTYEREAIKNLQLAYKALNDGQERDFEDYIARAKASMATGWHSPQERSAILSRSFRGYESMIEKIDKEFLKGGDPEKAAARLQAYIKRVENRK